YDTPTTAISTLSLHDALPIYAVVRNRLRRMIKEIMRRHIDHVRGGYDLVIIVRKGALELDYAAMEKSLRHVLHRAALWTNATARSEEHTSELQSRENLVCRLL